MLQIEVRNKRYNCDLTLRHKVSVFKGDSGVGKTWLVKALMDPAGGYKVKYSQPVIPVLLNVREWQYQLSNDYKGIPLFIADDCDFVFTKEFGELFNKAGICYLMLMARTSANVDKLNKMNTISVSGDAVYNFVSNGIEHSIVADRDFRAVYVETKVECNKVLCEDSGSGFTFFKHLYGNNNVLSSYGKDSIVKHILENYEMYQKVDRLLLIIDYAAIGLRLREILNVLKLCDIKAYIITEYKSFEYMLLRSNMFGIPEDKIHENELMYPSLEQACERLLTDITKGRIYTYDKSKDLKPCYYADCCSLDRSQIQCDKGLSGNKFRALLINTEFEVLLKVEVVQLC